MGTSGSGQGQPVGERVGGGEPLRFLGSRAHTLWVWRWLPRQSPGRPPALTALYPSLRLTDSPEGGGGGGSRGRPEGVLGVLCCSRSTLGSASWGGWTGCGASGDRGSDSGLGMTLAGARRQSGGRLRQERMSEWLQRRRKWQGGRSQGVSCSQEPPTPRAVLRAARPEVEGARAGTAGGRGRGGSGWIRGRQAAEGGGVQPGGVPAGVHLLNLPLLGKVGRPPVWASYKVLDGL